MDHIDRDAVTVWPLDAWARRAEFDDGDTLYWTNLKITDWRMPRGWDHVAWCEQGGDKGPLIRNQRTGVMAMLLPTGAIRSVYERNATTALAVINARVAGAK